MVKFSDAPRITLGHKNLPGSPYMYLVCSKVKWEDMGLNGFPENTRYFKYCDFIEFYCLFTGFRLPSSSDEKKRSYV